MFSQTILVSLIYILCIDSCLAKSSVNDYLEDDEAFEAFLIVAMRNYTNWLAARDPLNPIVEKIDLTSDQNIHPGVDAHFSVMTQYMSGHSKSYRSLMTAVSDMEQHVFSITRGVDFEEPFLFGGTYTSNGTIQTGSTKSNFSGGGEWKLYSNETFEYTVFKYTLNESGYIDINPETIHYLYDINWTQTEYQGLKLMEDANITANDYIDQIKNVLAQMYKSFLNNYRQYPNEVNPPKHLLFEYFRGIFSETNMSDVLLIGESYRNPKPNSGASISVLEGKMLVTSLNIFFVIVVTVLQ